jgi:hypothetical protein
MCILIMSLINFVELAAYEKSAYEKRDRHRLTAMPSGHERSFALRREDVNFAPRSPQ